MAAIEMAVAATGIVTAVDVAAVDAGATGIVADAAAAGATSLPRTPKTSRALPFPLTQINTLRGDGGEELGRFCSVRVMRGAY